MGPHTQTKRQLVCKCKVGEGDEDAHVANLHPIVIHIGYQPLSHAAPPSVGVTPSEPVLSVGDPLRLTCTGSDCVGTFNFSWFIGGSPVNASLVTVNNVNSTTSQLSVTSVTSADFGTYTCQVTNVQGTGTAVASVRDAGECS